MLNPMSLAGQKILITGASKGIGRASALLFAELGATLVLVARDKQKLDELINELPKRDHINIACDLSNLDTAEGIITQACADGVKLTGFLHSAGIGPAVPLRTLSVEIMEDIFKINFFAFMELCRYFVKPRFSSGGSIVALSSISAHAGWQGLSAYGASKGALTAAIKSMAIELAPRHYRVNAVAPSNIKTEMLTNMMKNLSAEEVAKIEAKQPLGFGRPEDVAHAAAFLLSDASRFITGTSLVVDGGYLAL